MPTSPGYFAAIPSPVVVDDPLDELDDPEEELDELVADASGAAGGDVSFDEHAIRSR